MHFSPKQKSKTFGQLHLYSLGIPLLASYTNVNQLSLKDAKCRKHAHCFGIKWKAENDRVLNYYLPISILLFSTTTTTYTNDNAAAHQIVISKTFLMSPHMTILGHPHKIFVLRNNRKQKIVSISFPFTRISVSASFPGKLKSHKRRRECMLTF